MDKETYDAALSAADKISAVAHLVEGAGHKVLTTATGAAGWLEQWAENIRTEATRQRSSAVWGDAADKPSSGPSKPSSGPSGPSNGPSRPSGNKSGTGAHQPFSEPSEPDLLSHLERLAGDYLKDSGFDADDIASFINDKFNRPSQ